MDIDSYSMYAGESCQLTPAELDKVSTLKSLMLHKKRAPTTPETPEYNFY
jgi:hypothetical protein